MPPLVSSAFLQSFLKQLNGFRLDDYLCDCRLVVGRRDGRGDDDDGESTPIEFAAHKLVLAASSPYFRDLFARQSHDQQRQTVTVNLKHCSAECVDTILQYLYSGELHLRNCDPADVLKVAKACQILSLEQILSSHTELLEEPNDAPQRDTAGGFLSRLCNPKFIPCGEASSSTSTLPYVPNVSTPLRVKVPDPVENGLDYSTPMSTGMYSPPLSAPAMLNMSMANAIANSMAALAANAVNRAGYYGPLLPTTASTPSEPSSAPPFPALFPPNFSGLLGQPMSASTPGSPQGGNYHKHKGVNIPGLDISEDGEGMILPTAEKEGWCRNKKYIQKVANGFMCIVCKKIYGRYNSVSYHVTIYHRNPPIKCDEPGCQFTTREARYIHFHKYYRHGTTLPKTIDLGTRSCPFCRHVAKSPAMLDKHVARHLPDSKRILQPIKCTHCDEMLSTQKEILLHQVKHANVNQHRCPHCSYRGRSSSSLGQHIMFKHSTDLFTSHHTCTTCDYKAPNAANLIAHQRRKHKIGTDTAGGSGTDEELIEESEGEAPAPPPSQCTHSDESKAEALVFDGDEQSPLEVSSDLDDSHSKLTAATTGYHSMVDYGAV